MERRGESPLRPGECWQALAQPSLLPDQFKALAVTQLPARQRLCPARADGGNALAARENAEAQGRARRLGPRPGRAWVHGVAARPGPWTQAQVCGLGGALTHLPRFASPAFTAPLAMSAGLPSSVTARRWMLSGSPLWLAADSPADQQPADQAG